jgi:hypothetical protein
MFKGTSSGLVLLLPVLVLALAFGQGTASAAVKSGCGPDGPIVNPTNPDNPCNKATVSAQATSVTFTGTVQANPNTVPSCDRTATPNCVAPTNDSPCPEQSGDPVNVLCEHFILTAAVAGNANVCITFPPGMFGDNEVDVFIVDPTNGTILGTPGTAATTLSTGDQQVCTSADLTANQTVEILVQAPFLDEFSDAITGVVTFTPKSTVVISCFKYYGQYERGGGDDDHHGHYHAQGHRDDKRGEKGGKVHYRNDDEGYHFHSTQIDDVEFTQVGTTLTGQAIWKLHMAGEGVDNGQPVTFAIDEVDAGGNGLDSFLITTSDGKTGGGHVTNGGNHYEHYDD